MAAYRDKRLKTAKPNTVRIELALLSHLFTVARQEWGLGGGQRGAFHSQTKAARGA